MADHDVVNVRYLVTDVNTSVDGERPTPGAGTGSTSSSTTSTPKLLNCRPKA